jgi:F-type H+-transporting ATPase subunit b
MELLLPQFGLFFWTAVVFLILLILLRKFAWKPIMTALKQRQESIDNALKEAEKARAEMAELKAENERIRKEALEERDQILQEANKARDQKIQQAEQEAQEKADKMIEDARKQIEQERSKAFAEVQEQAAEIAVDVAEKILRRQFEDKNKQSDYAKSLIQELNLN